MEEKRNQYTYRRQLNLRRQKEVNTERLLTLLGIHCKEISSGPAFSFPSMGTVCECCQYLPGHSNCLIRTGFRPPLCLLLLGSVSVDLPTEYRGPESTLSGEAGPDEKIRTHGKLQRCLKCNPNYILAILLKYFTSYFQKAKETLVLFLTGFVTVSEPRSHVVAQASLFQLDVLCSQG